MLYFKRKMRKAEDDFVIKKMKYFVLAFMLIVFVFCVFIGCDEQSEDMESIFSEDIKDETNESIVEERLIRAVGTVTTVAQAIR